MADIVLTLDDDGGGIRLDAVRRKAIERGLMDADSDLSDHEVLQFILEAGFSTAEKVTQISGVASAWTWCTRRSSNWAAR